MESKAVETERFDEQTGDSQALQESLTRKLVIVLFMTLFTLVLWGGLKVIESFNQEPETNEYESYRKELPSDINYDLLDELVEREKTFKIVEVDGSKVNTGSSTTDSGQ